MLRACDNGVEDDYWIAVAKCLNLADDQERRECLDEADEARAENKTLCSEQNDVRKEVCDLLGEAPYDPAIAPGHFLSPEDAAENPHPYFPLVPGTRWVYVNGDETTEVTVTEDTVEILGVTCFVVKDVVSESGEVTEDTDDWFAQDEDGNVWYFGELSSTLEGGELVSLEGSWKGGVDGAKPGIIMKASPQVGDAYRQEFSLGDVEDLAVVLSITGTEQVPAASCDGDCVVTREFTPIEPGAEEHKYYASGVGPILELDPETGERMELVQFHPGRDSIARQASPSSEARMTVQSSPNPLRSESTIRFELPRPASVSAEIFDSSGRRVRTIARGPREAGIHTLRWNGTDGSDRRLAAGIYFLRLRAGDETLTEKLLVVE